MKIYREKIQNQNWGQKRSNRVWPDLEEDHVDHWNLILYRHWKKLYRPSCQYQIKMRIWTGLRLIYPGPVSIHLWSRDRLHFWYNVKMHGSSVLIQSAKEIFIWWHMQETQNFGAFSIQKKLSCDALKLEFDTWSPIRTNIDLKLIVINQNSTFSSAQVAIRNSILAVSKFTKIKVSCICHHMKISFEYFLN